MADVLLSSQKLLERLGREEQQLKQLGLVNHAAGVRVAITAMLKLTEAEKGEPPSNPALEPSD